MNAPRWIIVTLSLCTLPLLPGCAKPPPPVQPTAGATRCTPCARCPACPKPRSKCDVMQEEDVTTVSVLQVFRNAFIKADIDADGDIMLRTKTGKTFIKVDRDRKLIKFISGWGFKASATQAQKLAFVNLVNSDLILVKFYVNNKGSLRCEYFIPFEDGVMPVQIVRSLKWFSKVELGAVTKYDKHKIIK